MKPPPTDAGAPSETRGQLRELLGRSVHDLRNPLSVVRASLEWLELELADREDALDAVRDATSATSRILVIVDDLDTLAHLETNPRIARGSVDLGECIARVTSSASTRFAARRVTIATTAPSSLEAIGDTRLLERSIDALVDDCARSSPPGGVVEVEAKAVDGAAEITIALRGTAATGVRVASIDALQTSGLGVYLALRVVEAHGGSLAVITTATTPRVIVRLPR